jgi:hypothetical protein
MSTGLSFDADTHTYFLDGRAVPRSVTGVLKAAGLIDFSAIPGPILDAARRRGTVVHQAVHYFNERDLDLAQFETDFPAYMPYVTAWIKFTTQRSFVPVLCEYRVVSRRHEVAGTIDCLGLLDGVAVLLDFATGDPGDVAKDLQTAAYLALAFEWADEDPALAAFIRAYPAVRRYGVALRGDGSFALAPYLDPLDLRHFLTLVEAQRIVEARRRARSGVAA